MPSVLIGASNDGEEYQLFRVTSTGRMPDGSIVIGNSGTREVRIFGQNGGHRRTMGREGDGPGEFRGVDQVIVSEDSILVWDASAFRASGFASDGSLARSVAIDRNAILTRLQPPLGLSPDSRLLPNGDLVFNLIRVFGAPGADDRSFGALSRPPVVVVRSSQNLARWDTLAVQLGSEQVHFSGGPIGVFPLFPAYQRVAVRAIGHLASRIYLGDQSSREISCFAADGTETMVRWRAERLSVTAEEVAVWRAERIEGIGRLVGRGRGEALVDRVPVPRTREPYGRIFLDLEGNLWVEQAPSLLAGEPKRFLVFDRTGRWLGETVMPDITPLEIGDDYVIGLKRSEWGIESVGVWAITKPVQ